MKSHTIELKEGTKIRFNKKSQLEGTEGTIKGKHISLLGFRNAQAYEIDYIDDKGNPETAIAIYALFDVID